MYTSSVDTLLNLIHSDDKLINNDEIIKIDIGRGFKMAFYETLSNQY